LSVRLPSSCYVVSLETNAKDNLTYLQIGEIRRQQ